MTRFRTWAQRLLIIVGGGALLVMMLHITTAVLLRSTVGITLAGTIELVSFYYMVTAVFAGLALVAVLNEQVIVEVFTGWMRRGSLALLDAAAAFLGAGYAGLLAWGAWLEAGSATRFNELVPIKSFDLAIWPARWLAFGGLAVIALASAIYVIVLLRRGICK